MAWQRRCRVLLFAIVAVAGSAARAQEQKKLDVPVEPPAPNVKVKFYEDFRCGDPANPNLRFIRDNIRWEPEGARITMPSGKGRLPTTGIATNFQIKGDFQVTATYEILKAEKPTEGYGVGISVYLAIDTNTGNAISLARRVGKNGNAIFMSDRMKPNAEKPSPDHFVRTRPSKAPIGKLRVERVGSMVRFLIADGEGSAFVHIFQDGMMRLETEFGTNNIRWIQFDGDAGDSEAELDVRLLDFAVEAEELPGIIDTARKSAPPPATNQTPTNPNVSATAFRLETIVFVGASFVGLLTLGLGAWFLLRHRAKPTALESESSDEPQPDPVPASILFACSECDRKRRAKVEAAGKKLKCQRCGAVTTVPDADADESYPDPS